MHNTQGLETRWRILEALRLLAADHPEGVPRPVIARLLAIHPAGMSYHLRQLIAEGQVREVPGRARNDAKCYVLVDPTPTAAAAEERPESVAVAPGTAS
jgi:hypothetical protein